MSRELYVFYHILSHFFAILTKPNLRSALCWPVVPESLCYSETLMPTYSLNYCTFCLTFSIINNMSLAEDIKQKAFELGLDLIGITNASPLNTEQVELFAGWLKAGYAGQMNYMHKNLEKRINPAGLLENASSVIVAGLNYTLPKCSSQSPNPPGKSHSQHTTNPTGRVANYAQYEDYHLFIKKQLRKLANFISSITAEDPKFKICVDSAPVAERPLAVRAGLGFVGKNHMLINPEFGPQIFLGEIITDLKLQTDEPIIANCSTCNKCIAACPTGALRPDGQFDTNKCVSYLTIEYKDRIPSDLAEKIGNWLFGCDECVLACPYQKNAPLCKNEQFKFYRERVKLDLQQISSLTQREFEIEFADSPIKRLGLKLLKRNAQICMENTHHRRI